MGELILFFNNLSYYSDRIDIQRRFIEFYGWKNQFVTNIQIFDLNIDVTQQNISKN
jgi:hypothetical protein